MARENVSLATTREDDCRRDGEQVSVADRLSDCLLDQKGCGLHKGQTTPSGEGGT